MSLEGPERGRQSASGVPTEAVREGFRSVPVRPMKRKYKVTSKLVHKGKGPIRLLTCDHFWDPERCSNTHGFC